MKTINILIIILFLASSCNLLNTERQLEGEAFIVTKGGDNIPLGLIDIAAIEEDLFKEAFNHSVGLYEKQLEGLIEKLDDRRAMIKELENKEQELWAAVVAEGKSKTVADFIGERNYLDKALYGTDRDVYHTESSANEVLEYIGSYIKFSHSKRTSKSRDKYGTYKYTYEWAEPWIQIPSQSKYYSNLRELEKQKINLNSDLKKISEFKNGMSLLLPVTTKYSSTKTNSNGQFKLTLSRNKKYFITAVAARSVGNEQEVYLWVIPLERGKENIDTFFLSNDNMTTNSDILSLLAKYI